MMMPMLSKRCRRREDVKDKEEIRSYLTSFVRIPSVLREERPRGIISPTRFKNIQFISRPSVHVRRFHSRDVHAERSVDAGAIEAHEDAVVFARPFRVRGVAIETQSVAFFTTQRVEQFVALFVDRCVHILCVCIYV